MTYNMNIVYNDAILIGFQKDDIASFLGPLIQYYYPLRVFKLSHEL